MKVAIIYGWSEGRWQGKRLRTELRRQGYSVTRWAKRADVIIAHSGGCFMLPPKTSAHFIMLVGIPYGHHPLKGLIQKLRHELKDTWWYKKTFYNTYYWLTRPFRWHRMRKHWKKHTIPRRDDASIYLIRNQEDYFIQPLKADELAQKNKWELRTFNGHHDDLWINPKPYVDLIKKHTN